MWSFPIWYFETAIRDVSEKLLKLSWILDNFFGIQYKLEFNISGWLIKNNKHFSRSEIFDSFGALRENNFLRRLSFDEE